MTIPNLKPVLPLILLHHFTGALAKGRQAGHLTNIGIIIIMIIIIIIIIIITVIIIIIIIAMITIIIMAAVYNVHL